MAEGELMGRVVGNAADRELEFEEELELMCGAPPRWYDGESAFADEAERRAAYEGHRDRLGGWLGGFAGNRSVAFWRYDSDLDEEPEGDDRLLWLAAHGCLEPGELSEIAKTSEDAKDRIGTTAEVIYDVKTATLHERVTKALQ
jgi:hypothetical protein